MVPTSPVSIATPWRAVAALMAVVLGGLVLAGCSSSDGDDKAATARSTTTAKSSTTTTTERVTTTRPPKATTTTSKPADPRKPPPASAITPAYVQGVLNRLYGLYRQAFAAAKAENAFNERYQVLMQAAYTPDATARETTGFQRFGGVAVIAPPAAITQGEGRAGAFRHTAVCLQ